MLSLEAGALARGASGWCSSQDYWPTCLPSVVLVGLEHVRHTFACESDFYGAQALMCMLIAAGDEWPPQDCITFAMALTSRESAAAVASWAGAYCLTEALAEAQAQA